MNPLWHTHIVSGKEWLIDPFADWLYPALQRNHDNGKRHILKWFRIEQHFLWWNHLIWFFFQMKEAAQCRQFDELRTGDGMVGQVIFFCTLQICSQSFSNPVVYIPKLFKNNCIFQICFQSFQNQLYIFLSVLQEHHGACGKCSKGVKKDLLNNFENRSLYSQNIVLHITSMDGVRWCVDGAYVHIKRTKKRGGWWLGFEFWMVCTTGVALRELQSYTL